MLTALANALSGAGAAISGAFSWGLAKLNLFNSAAEQKDAEGLQDQGLADRLNADQAKGNIGDIRDVDAE